MLVATVLSGLVIILLFVGIIGFSINPTVIKSSAWLKGHATNPAESNIYIGLESFYTSTTDAGSTFTTVTELTASTCSSNTQFTPIFATLVTLSENQCSVCSNAGQISFALTLVATTLVILLLALSICRILSDSIDRKESSVFVSASACAFAVASFVSFQSTCLQSLTENAGPYTYGFGPAWICLVIGSALLVIITSLHICVPIHYFTRAATRRKSAEGYAIPGDEEISSAEGGQISQHTPRDNETPIGIEPPLTERSSSVRSTPERRTPDSSDITPERQKSIRLTPLRQDFGIPSISPERQKSARFTPLPLVLEMPGIAPENLVSAVDESELV